MESKIESLMAEQLRRSSKRGPVLGRLLNLDDPKSVTQRDFSGSDVCVRWKAYPPQHRGDGLHAGKVTVAVPVESGSAARRQPEGAGSGNCTGRKQSRVQYPWLKRPSDDDQQQGF